MKLELGHYCVADLQFGPTTQIRDGILFVERDELRDHLLKNGAFLDVEIDIAHPGENTRIVNVLDIVDPRKKVGEDVEVFPGLVGELKSVGDGRINILRNVAIVEAGFGEKFFGGIIDMAGEGSRYCPYAKTHNLVLRPVPFAQVTAASYAKSLKLASLSTSIYLGKATLGIDPVEIKTVVFDEKRERPARLPRVGYIWQTLSHYDLRGVYYYGNRSCAFYPLLISPNEIFEGALVSGHYDHSPALKNYTHTILNHPVVMELCERDGIDLDFAGIILTNAPRTVEEKNRNALMNTRLAKSVLKADGAIITKEGGGHTDIDLMETCRSCEKAGIRTAIIDIEMLDPNGEGEYPLVVFVPEADCIVSAGNIEEKIRLQQMDRLLGGEARIPGVQHPAGAIEIPLGFICGAISEIGASVVKGQGF